MGTPVDGRGQGGDAHGRQRAGWGRPCTSEGRVRTPVDDRRQRTGRECMYVVDSFCLGRLESQLDVAVRKSCCLFQGMELLESLMFYLSVSSSTDWQPHTGITLTS